MASDLTVAGSTFLSCEGFCVKAQHGKIDVLKAHAGRSDHPKIQNFMAFCFINRLCVIPSNSFHRPEMISATGAMCM